MDTTTTRRFKLQLIVEGGRWPYVGNGYQNKDGSINIVLDPDTELRSGQRLHLRAAFKPATSTGPRTGRREAAGAPAETEGEPQSAADLPPQHMALG